MAKYAKIVTVFGLLSLANVFPASAEVVSLRIAAHPSLRNVISNAEADSVLKRASVLITKEDGGGDVACPIDLVRNGDVQYPASIPTEVDNGSYNALRSTGADIVFVPSIISCANAGPSAIGCTWFGGVVSLEAAYRRDGLVLAHEFGHYRYLPDVDVRKRIMYRIAIAGNWVVTSAECNSFLGGGGGLMAADSNEEPPITASHSDDDSLSVDELLNGPWPGGVKQFVPSIRKIPTEEIAKVRAAAGPGDPLRQLRAIWILAIVGNDTDLKFWEKVLSNSDNSIESIALKKAAFESLGVFIRRTESTQATSMLEKYAEEVTSLKLSRNGDASEDKSSDINSVSDAVLSGAASRAMDASGIADGLRSPGSRSEVNGGNATAGDRVVDAINILGKARNSQGK